MACSSIPFYISLPSHLHIFEKNWDRCSYGLYVSVRQGALWISWAYSTCIRYPETNSQATCKTMVAPVTEAKIHFRKVIKPWTDESYRTWSIPLWSWSALNWFIYIDYIIYAQLTYDQRKFKWETSDIRTRSPLLLALLLSTVIVESSHGRVK